MVVVNNRSEAAQPRSRWSIRSLVTAVLLAPLAAQEVQPTPSAGQASPPAKQEPAPANTPPTTPVAATPQYAKVVTDGLRLHCWPGTAEQPPQFEDVLAKDTVVAVGRAENGFRAVQLPFGPVGYISKRFTEVGEGGVVRTKGTKVAFRYRAKGTEAPVAQLANATEIAVIGEQDDWFRVRVPGIDAWVREADLQIGAAGDTTLAAAYDELRARHQAEIQARLDAIAAADKLAAQNKLDLEAVRQIETAFAAELQKPAGEQKFEPITTAMQKLLASLGAESAARPALDTLGKRIETQRWIADATAVRDEKPKIDNPVTASVQPKDELGRFQAIGWLRYERRLVGPGVFYLEKGGRRLHVVTCSTNRYNLSMFIDREVGLIGPRRSPATESLSQLDVEKIEVLGTPSP